MVYDTNDESNDQWHADENQSESGNENLVPAPPERPKSPLRHLQETQISLERLRISVGNRISALDTGVDHADKPVPDIYNTVFETLQHLEDAVDTDIASELRTIPVWNTWLSHVCGIGPSLGGQLLSYLLPPLMDRGPSTWYKAAGLEPTLREDGLWRLPRPTRGGGKITYHPYLRRCLFNVSTSLVRTGRYYRAVYEEEKRRLVELHRDDENWPPIRVDRVARWAMIKRFLSHLYEEWLKAEGKVIDGRNRPYVVERLAHHYIAPPQWDHKTKM